MITWFGIKKLFRNTWGTLNMKRPVDPTHVLLDQIKVCAARLPREHKYQVWLEFFYNKLTLANEGENPPDPAIAACQLPAPKVLKEKLDLDAIFDEVPDDPDEPGNQIAAMFYGSVDYNEIDRLLAEAEEPPVGDDPYAVLNEPDGYAEEDSNEGTSEVAGAAAAAPAIAKTARPCLRIIRCS